MALVHLNEESFDKAINSDAPVLVDFWATWCVHCKPVGAIMEQLAEEYEGQDVVIAKVDIDASPTIPLRYGVMGVPTVLLFQNGEEVDRKVGAMPYDEYADMLDGALG